MKKNIIINLIYPLLFISMCIACRNRTAPSSLPADFSDLQDSIKIELLVKKFSPDSVARFICSAAIDRNGYQIGDFPFYIRTVHSLYNEEDRMTFSQEVDNFTESLPSAEKLKLYYLASREYPYKLGYRLGKEYANAIKEGTISDSKATEDYNIMMNLYENDGINPAKFSKGFNLSFKRQ